MNARKHTRTRLPAADGDDRASPLAALTAALTGALLAARLLLPTESAWQGHTLWIVQLWLGAGVLWVWDRYRQGRWGLRWTRLETAVGLVAAGHVLSAAHVIVAGGDQRAATNMAWEWIGLVTAAVLVRQVVASEQAARRLAAVMLAAAVALSGLGLWQHWVFYPQTARQYDSLRQELDRLLSADASEPAGVSPGRRVRQLQQELLSLGVPAEALEGPSRLLFEQRLRASREPFGMFALANTFAGWLLAWLMVGAGMVLGGRNAAAVPGTGRVIPGLALGIPGLCLLLTKSRTAWAGLIVGLGTWGLVAGLRTGTAGLTRRAIVAATVLAAGMGVLAASGGGLDRQVWSEAPKSLRYRVQYWSASWDVVREAPLWGVGPGNFRQHYLKYKRPESSEEIADPHNLLLDVWTSGGVTAVAGLAVFLAALVTLGRAVPSQPELDGARASTPLGPIVLGAGGGFWLVLGYYGVLGEGWDLRLAVLFAAWTACIACLRRVIIGGRGVSTACLVGAATGLCVHLLGAGGIGMPAVAQTLFLLPVLAGGQADLDRRLVEAGRESGEKPPPRHFRAFLVVGMLLPVLFVGCLLTGTIPALYRRVLIGAAETAWLVDGNAQRAMSLLSEAAERDPWSPEPVRRMADLAYHRWRVLPGASEVDFRRVVELGRLAIEKDPRSPHGYRILGQQYLEAYERTRNPQHAEAAVTYFQQAAERYPQWAVLRAELASALASADRQEEAREEARRALDLDAVNRRENHVDKFLPPEMLERMRQLAPSAN